MVGGRNRLMRWSGLAVPYQPAGRGLGQAARRVRAVLDDGAILAVAGEHPFLTEPLLRLIRWLADYYCAPLESSIRNALPAPVRREGAGVSG